MKKNATAIGVLIIWSAIAVCTILATEPVAGSQTSHSNERGKKLYMQYCAVCHGTDGKGNGPAAEAMKVPPPDLTMIQKEGEKFPSTRVQIIIDGEKAVTSHGTSGMPIWGTIFRRSGGEMQQRGDVYALTKYIESIQAAHK